MRLLIALVGAVAYISAAGVPVWSRQPPTVPTLLAAAADYVKTYEEKASAFVFEEEYQQQVSGVPEAALGRNRSDTGFGVAKERLLRSEVVVINTGDAGWVGFRDVFEVDGRPVRDRQDRLQKLFGNPNVDVMVQARAVAAESARFNAGSVQRNLNYPTMALMFLRQGHQNRSTFSRDGSARVSGIGTWIVRFQEVNRPTLIGSQAGDVIASGQFWIEPDSGRVWRSRLTVEEARATGIVDVVYGTWPGIDVLMPVSMEETITARNPGEVRPAEVIRGEARYSNFKQFTVEVKTTPVR